MRLLGAIMLCAYLLLFPARAAQAALDALALWARVVCPALLPFFAMLPVLTGAEALRAYSRVCARFTRFMFGLPVEAAAAVVVGLVAGSPAGALAVRRAYSAGAIKREHILGASVLASGCGPVFLMSAVGAGLFESSGAGWALIFSQICALFTVGALIRLIPDKHLMKSDAPARINASEANAPPSAIKDAVINLLVVGGWMALFGVISSALPAPVKLIMELASGCELAARTGSVTLVAGVCGFGGLCIMCQNLSALKGLGVRKRVFCGAKVLCGALCAMYCHIIERAAPDLKYAGARLTYIYANAPRALPIAAALASFLALAVVSICYYTKYIVTTQPHT